jgi:hypothetical protein
VLNFADSAANRMSQDTARINPTPAQAPLIAAITGLRSSRAW